MKWLKWLLIGVAALLLLFAAVSLALASPLRVEHSVAIAAPAGKTLPPIVPRTGSTGRTVPERSEPQVQGRQAATCLAAGFDHPKRLAATS